MVTLLKSSSVLRIGIDGHNKSLDASGGSVFCNLPGGAEGALIRAAASTQTLDCSLDPGGQKYVDL
jgi:hypothetical protein